jgi:hypothetical protein
MSENRKALLLFALLALIPGGLTFALARLAAAPWLLAGALGVVAWYGGFVAQCWAWGRSEGEAVNEGGDSMRDKNVLGGIGGIA